MSNASTETISEPYDAKIDIDQKMTGNRSFGFDPLEVQLQNGHETHLNRRSDSSLDPWKITEMATFGVPWSSLTTDEKIKRVVIGILKGIGLLIFLYFFVCSLDLLSLGFRLVGGRTTGDIFQQSEILKNPVVGVMVGILTTVLVQSSSTSTSIIVSMVSAEFLSVKMAIPIIMGANIGTSITNTIVSLTQAGDRNQFRRAFAGATVHDMFNWLTVITLLIVEVSTGYLYHLTTAIMDGVSQNSTEGLEVELLGKITKPFVNLIVQIDSKVLNCWSNSDCHWANDSSLMKVDCTKKKAMLLELPSIFNETEQPYDECNYLFTKFNLGDGAAGAIVLVGSLICLCVCLILIVKVLNSVLQGQIAVVIKKTLNAKVPYIPWITGYIAILVGALMTFLVQSSSVFTSALTPLVGLGVISVERTYPLTLGSNIGTTTTSLLAAMAVQSSSFKDSMQIALCHLFFNITGILLFYPIPFMRFPIAMSKFLGDTTAKYRWFAIVYMVLMFAVLPAIVMGLSFAGTWLVITFASIVFAIFAFVLIVNLIRSKFPSILPEVLKTWKWLPIGLRSLEPYDRFLTQFACCRRLKDKNQDNPVEDPFSQSPTKTNLSLDTVSTEKPNSDNALGGGNVNQGFID